jgi:hypothetical protein
MTLTVKGVVRRFHAASLISGTLISFSGLSQTGPAGCRLRVLPDQRCGFCARAFAERLARFGDWHGLETGAVCKRRGIISSVARTWRDEADGAVQVLCVIPTGEGFHPSLCIGPRGKSLSRPVRAIFAGSEQSLGERVVITDARPAEGRNDPRFFHRGFHSGTFHRAAIGLPFSACRTSGRAMQPSAMTICRMRMAANSALSRS